MKYKATLNSMDFGHVNGFGDTQRKAINSAVKAYKELCLNHFGRTPAPEFLRWIRNVALIEEYES